MAQLGKKGAAVVRSAVVVLSLLGIAVGLTTAGSMPAAAAARGRVVRTTTTTTQPTTTSSTVAAPTSSSSLLFGAATDDTSASMPLLSSFESHAGKTVGLYGLYKSFYWDKDFPTTDATTLRNRGAVPMITWEPWNPSNGVNQPTYSMAAVANGNFDTMIRNWATEIKTFGSPVWLRFAHEMNGDWYPWAEGVNGNGAGSYVAAFRHVHDVFAAAGVSNVSWVWNPNIVVNGIGASLSSLYPGDAYVDMVGIDGYNWGTSASWSSWQSAQDVFGATMTQVRAITNRGIVIGETASAEAGGNKADWISSFFSFMKANTDIKAFVWFEFQKETDWRIESSSAAQAAFASAVSGI